MKYFYEQTKILDELKTQPSPKNLGKVIDIIRDADSLTLHFYGGEDNKTLPDFGWIELLFNAGEFNDLNALPEKCGLTQRFKADFIKEATQEKPEIVLKAITSLKPKDGWIQQVFLEALDKMTLALSEKALRIIWDYLGEKRYHIWHWQGEQAAKIMLKLSEEKLEEAFSIASLLLEVWVPEKEEQVGIRDECIRWQEHDYTELIEKYYKPLWEKYPYRGFELLVQNLNNYLNTVEQKENNDPSEFYYITVEKIDEGSSWGHENFISIYISALRDCLNNLIEHEQSSIDKTLELLRRCKKAVFTRFELYLLSKIGTEKHKERINDIAKTKEYFERLCFQNEYDLLVTKKKDLLTNDTKKIICKWIDEITIDRLQDFKEWFEQRYEKECTDEDIKRYESRYRAGRLYPIQEVFPEEYAKYKELSGTSEEELKPMPRHSEGWVSGDEGTPLTSEQMNEMPAADVLDFILDPTHYNYKVKEFRPQSPAEALGYAFQMAVKARPIDFINVDIEKIVKLPEVFISRYFNGLWDALRENAIPEFSWDRYIEIAQAVVNAHKDNNETATRLESLIECIQEGFKDRNKIDYTVDRLNTIFSIIEPLLTIQEESRMSEESDPVQIRCNSVTGEALLVCLSIGIVFKRDFQNEYEATFKSKLEEVFNCVLTKIKTPWMVCTFGSDFPRIYWLVPEWVEENLDLILSDENWNIVWGTYLHWGRPSKELFNFLCSKGIYEKAIQKKDDIQIPKRSQKEPRKELAKHFVIAYFNGWIESYENELLQTFLNTVDDDLLSYNAHFFTTGFESQKADPKEDVKERLKNYWEKRLEVIEANPENHLNEASGFGYWIKNCPLDDTTALELEERTLSASQGKLRDDYEARECIEALCSCANDENREKTIRCIRLIVNNPPEYMYWEDLKEGLGKLLNAVVEDEKASKELIQEAMGLADDLGRQRVYDYKDVFDILSEHLDDPDG